MLWGTQREFTMYTYKDLEREREREKKKDSETSLPNQRAWNGLVLLEKKTNAEWSCGTDLTREESSIESVYIIEGKLFRLDLSSSMEV